MFSVLYSTFKEKFYLSLTTRLFVFIYNILRIVKCFFVRNKVLVGAGVIWAITLCCFFISRKLPGSAALLNFVPGILFWSVCFCLTTVLDISCRTVTLCLVLTNCGFAFNINYGI